MNICKKDIDLNHLPTTFWSLEWLQRLKNRNSNFDTQKIKISIFFSSKNKIKKNGVK